MASGLATAARGLFLVILLAFGGAGASVLDAVVYHRHGSADGTQRPHVEAPGAEHHADRCGLSQPLPVPRLAVGLTGSILPLAQFAAASLAPPPAAPHVRPPSSLQHQRAPPAFG